MRESSKIRAENAFPTVRWGGETATFKVGNFLPPGLPRLSAALVFAMEGEEFALANITGRGWCIPGGRIEAGETPEQAARRETLEEIGATLGPLTLLGWYVLTNSAEGLQTAIPTYRAEVLHYGERPSGFESLGVGKFRPEALRDIYFSWDALLEAVVALAAGTSDKPRKS